MIADIFSNSHIRIKADPADAVLIVTWAGRQTEQTVMDGCMRIYECMKTLQRFDILNDNRHVIGDWREASQWVGTVWFPLMDKAGLKKFAWIKSPLDLPQASIDETLSSVDISVFPIRVFHDYQQGFTWLMKS